VDLAITFAILDTLNIFLIDWPHTHTHTHTHREAGGRTDDSPMTSVCLSAVVDPLADITCRQLVWQTRRQHHDYTRRHI